MREQSIESLYTKRAALYDFLFLRLLGYENGLKALFNQTDVIKKGIKILDAGCGSGAVIKVLYQIGKNDDTDLQLYGFDKTEAMLKRCRKWMYHNNIFEVTIEQADVLHLDEFSKKHYDFDLIVCSAMLEYIPKKQMLHALQNLKKLLTSQGIFLMFITKDNYFNRLFMHHCWKAEMYTKGDLATLLYSADFHDVTFKCFPFPYNYLNLWGHIVEARIK